VAEFSLDAFVRALDRASEDIKREVGALIPAAADAMVARLESRYPLGRHHRAGVPHMRDDVRIRTRQGQDALLPVRQVRAPRLAYIWQDGTNERFDATRKNAKRGRMPAADPHFFERTAVQTRADMLARAQDILDRPREID
jgi:hypothetical protein